MRINANFSEQACSRSGSKQNDKVRCTLEIIKALCRLNNLARQYSQCLGDTLRIMGLDSSRVDPDAQIRSSLYHVECDHIATFADNLIVVAKEPFQYLKVLAYKHAA